MTITLELADDIEQAIARKAQNQGMTSAEYLRRMAERAAKPVRTAGTSKARRDADQKPKTGAEAWTAIEALNLPAGYGDPNIDSPELARQLAARFSRPDRSEASQ